MLKTLAHEGALALALMLAPVGAMAAVVDMPPAAVVEPALSMVPIGILIVVLAGAAIGALVVYGKAGNKRLEAVLAEQIGVQRAAAARAALDHALDVAADAVAAEVSRRFGSAQVDVKSPVVAAAARKVIERLPESTAVEGMTFDGVATRIAERAMARLPAGARPVELNVGEITSARREDRS